MRMTNEQLILHLKLFSSSQEEDTTPQLKTSSKVYGEPMKNGKVNGTEYGKLALVGFGTLETQTGNDPRKFQNGDLTKIGFGQLNGTNSGITNYTLNENENGNPNQTDRKDMEKVKGAATDGAVLIKHPKAAGNESEKHENGLTSKPVMLGLRSKANIASEYKYGKLKGMLIGSVQEEYLTSSNAAEFGAKQSDVKSCIPSPKKGVSLANILSGFGSAGIAKKPFQLEFNFLDRRQHGRESNGCVGFIQDHFFEGVYFLFFYVQFITDFHCVYNI